MGSPLAAFVWRDVVGKRWIRCTVWQAALSSVLFLVWEFVPKLSSPRAAGVIEAPVFFSALWACIRFFLFQASQMSFLLGQTFISEPEENDTASMAELAIEMWKRIWRAAMGLRGEEPTAKDTSEIRTKVRAKVDYISFAILCVVSGFLGFVSLLSSPPFSVGTRFLDIGLRGATHGFLYATIQSYQRKVSLQVPIIQRRLYFSFKMGIPPAVTTSCKLAVALLPLVEAVSQIIAFERGVKTDTDVVSVLWWQPWFAAGAFVVSLCWQLGHHLVQVLHTKLHEFAPPLGSPCAEKNPTDLLLMILEEPPLEIGSLVQYHAFLDLCNVSETNVDTWRRAAIFEETGDTYRRLINVCLKRLDGLTAILAQGLEGSEADKGMDSLRRQIESPDGDYRRLVFQQGDLSSSFQDFQICALSVRTLASLTSNSRSEDKYGVAQLHCCHAAVVSSLLSCLLVLEVYLGRRSSASAVPFAQKSVNWTVQGRGASVEKDKRKSSPFGKRTVLHKKAYALGDVVRTSLYQIVYAFSEEMVLVGSGGKGNLLAVKDWVSEKKPVYGTHDMHLQKLIAFLPQQVG